MIFFQSMNCFEDDVRLVVLNNSIFRVGIHFGDFHSCA